MKSYHILFAIFFLAVNGMDNLDDACQKPQHIKSLFDLALNTINSDSFLKAYADGKVILSDIPLDVENDVCRRLINEFSPKYSGAVSKKIYELACLRLKFNGNCQRSFSLNGNTLAANYDSKKNLIWNFLTGESKLLDSPGYGDLWWQEDTRFLGISTSSSIGVLDIENNSYQERFGPKIVWFKQPQAVSPDVTKLILYSQGDSRDLEFHEQGSISPLKGHFGQIKRLRANWHKNLLVGVEGSYRFSDSDNGSDFEYANPRVLCWDLACKKLTEFHHLNDILFEDCTVNRAGTIVAFSSGNKILMYTIETNELRTFEAPEEFDTFQNEKKTEFKQFFFSNDESFIIAKTKQGLLISLDIVNGTFKLLGAGNKYHLAACLSHDDNYLAFTLDSTQELCVRDLKTEAISCFALGEKFIHPNGWNPTNDFFVAHNPQGDVFLFDWQMIKKINKSNLKELLDLVSNDTCRLKRPAAIELQAHDQ